MFLATKYISHITISHFSFALAFAERRLVLEAMKNAYHGSDVEWEDRHLQTENAVIGRVLYKPGGSCGPRTQKDFQLVFMHSGNCKLNVDGDTRNLEAGYTYLLRPHKKEEFAFSKRRGARHSWCAISPNVLSKNLVEQLDKAPDMTTYSETMDRILALVFDIDLITNDYVRDFVELLALSLFLEYLNVSTSTAKSSVSVPLVNKAISYMEQHFPEEDCLEKCHEHAGVSRNTLIKKFRDVVKITPDKYLWRLRTEKGVAMLLHTGLGVSDIAFRCGFKNPFHFSRKVTKQQGMSPRQIRQKEWD